MRKRLKSLHKVIWATIWEVLLHCSGLFVSGLEWIRMMLPFAICSLGVYFAFFIATSVEHFCWLDWLSRIYTVCNLKLVWELFSLRRTYFKVLYENFSDHRLYGLTFDTTVVFYPAGDLTSWGFYEQELSIKVSSVAVKRVGTGNSANYLSSRVLNCFGNWKRSL